MGLMITHCSFIELCNYIIVCFVCSFPVIISPCTMYFTKKCKNSRSGPHDESWTMIGRQTRHLHHQRLFVHPSIARYQFLFSFSLTLYCLDDVQVTVHCSENGTEDRRSSLVSPICPVRPLSYSIRMGIVTSGNVQHMVLAALFLSGGNS